MKLTYRTSIDDVFEQSEKEVKSIARKASFSIIVIILYILASALIHFDAPPFAFIPVLLIMPIIYIFSNRITKRFLRKGLKKEFTKNGFDVTDTNISIEITDDFLGEKSHFGETKIPLAHVNDIEEKKGFIVIEFKYSDPMSIPIHGILNAEDKDAFILELKDKIASL